MYSAVHFALFNGLKVQDLRQETINLHRDIATSLSQIGVTSNNLAGAELSEDMFLFPEPVGSDSYLGDPELLGAPLNINRFKVTDLEDVLDWELVSKSLYSYKDLNPKRRIGSSIKEGLHDIIREIMELINVFSKQRGRVIDFKEIFYGYWRLDPVHGVDLILDLLLVYKKYRGRKMTVPVRRHAYIQQTFTGIEVREMTTFETANQKSRSDVLELKQGIINDIFKKIGKTLPLPVFTRDERSTKYINFILPLSDRYETLKRFLKVYEEVCLREKELTRLIVVLHKNSENLEMYEKNTNLLKNLQKKYAASEISILVTSEVFSRGRALQHGITSARNEDLLFFIDVDIVFNSKSLLRIRQSTVMSKRIYFPIVYSLYNPKLLNASYEMAYNSEFNVNERNGFWRQFGFGIVSIYKSDFIQLGGFNVSISGWGLEDVTFYDTVIKSNFKIARSVDPGLVHVYHPAMCDSRLEKAQKDMCIGTKANIFGPLRDLQKYYTKYKYLFR